MFDTFDKFLTVDLRLNFPGEQPKPQFPASKIFSVEQILWGTDPLGAPAYLFADVNVKIDVRAIEGVHLERKWTV